MRQKVFRIRNTTTANNSLSLLLPIPPHPPPPSPHTHTNTTPVRSPACKVPFRCITAWRGPIMSTDSPGWARGREKVGLFSQYDDTVYCSNCKWLSHKPFWKVLLNSQILHLLLASSTPHDTTIAKGTPRGKSIGISLVWLKWTQTVRGRGHFPLPTPQPPIVVLSKCC